MTHDLSTLRIAELTTLFREKAAEHAVIDIQSLYCDPDHPFARDFGYDFTRHHEAALRIDTFTRACRPHLAPFWVLNGYEYLGRAGNIAKTKKAGIDLPRLFCKAALYRQTPAEYDPMLVKHTKDAFDTWLPSALSERKTKALLLSGVDLGACVKATARTAFYVHGLDVYIIEDLVADSLLAAPADIHAYIKTIPGAKPVKSADVLTALHAAHQPVI